VMPTTGSERQGGKGHPVAGVLLAILGGVLWLLPVAMGVLIVPKFAEVFDKFDIRGGLPTGTVAVLAVGKAVSTWWPLVALVWLAVVGGLVGLCMKVRRPWPVVVAAVFAGLSLLGVGAAVVLMVVVLFLPLVRTVEVIGQG